MVVKGGAGNFLQAVGQAVVPKCATVHNNNLSLALLFV